MKLIIFGGTTEGRVIAKKLAECGHDVSVSVATELGAEELENISAEVLIGRLDADEIAELIKSFELVIDATHPYAVAVTENIKAACANSNKPLRRVMRSESYVTGCVRLKSCKSAAEYLQNTTGNILVATGAKELSEFSILDPQRVFARVLPTHSGITSCEAINLPHRNILALQGPFTQKLNEALMEQYNIRWLVTKDGGTVGGFEEKYEAAKNAGAELILVGRPDDDGISMEELLDELRDVK